jgi:hypothetical protein
MLKSYGRVCLFSNRSCTHILTRVEMPKPFRVASAFNSEMVESSSRNVMTRSFRSTRSLGRGRKSSTTLALSRSASSKSSVYSIFFFIMFFPFSPECRAEYPDRLCAVCEPDRHDLALNLAKAVVALLVRAVLHICENNTFIVFESLLRFYKRYAMLENILLVFVVIPFEIRRFHDANVIQTNIIVNCLI